MKKRIHVLYSGRVQGVGFRFTAIEVARRADVSGWVKNLDDGRVEVIAEADEKSLNDFLDGVKVNFSRYIRQAQVEWSDASGEFKDFRVNF